MARQMLVQLGMAGHWLFSPVGWIPVNVMP
jgi:hypothetical protein